MFVERQGDLARLELAQLAQNCGHELTRFRAGNAPGAAHCFELLRRALEDESQDAFACVFELYRAQVARWVAGHRMFDASGERTPDVFVNEAFIRLHRHLRGARFANFANTEAVLTYLKACAITALLEQNRKQRAQMREVSLGEAIGAEQVDPSRGVAVEQVWAIVSRALPDVRDRELIEQRFQQGLSPAQIAEQAPRHWRDARDVTVALQRCLRRLSRHYELMELLS
jgi:hypothetical protein